MVAQIDLIESLAIVESIGRNSGMRVEGVERDKIGTAIESRLTNSGDRRGNVEGAT